MRYQGPIYRPPSEADSLLVQATLGCPHNKCAFCMTYKQGPRFSVRPFEEIKQDMEEAATELGTRVRTLFLPAGNSMAMPTGELARVCSLGRELFPNLERITVYASMPAIEAHGADGLQRLKEAGLSRLHVGLESGHDPTLALMKKGTDSAQQVRAGRMALEAGLELCLYVVLGLAGPENRLAHAQDTARVINRINAAGPLTLRLRTLLPKINTLLLHWLNKGRFKLSTPYEIFEEAARLVEDLEGPLVAHSDHYTNYVNIYGQLPDDKQAMLQGIRSAGSLPRSSFRQDFVGTQ